MHSTLSVPGKKDAEMDRNFDTLDLPKRTEAAKGEYINRQSWGAWPSAGQGSKLCAIE